MKGFKVIIYSMLCMGIGLFFNHSKVEKYHYPCNGLNVITEIKNWKICNGKKFYVKSGKWDEYDENGSLNPIPDSLDVILSIDILSYYLKHSFKKGDEQISDFNISVEVKLKMSESTDCINVINPKISKEYTLINKLLVKYDDFFIKGIYKTYKLKKSLKIRELLKQTINNEKLMLAQIIVVTKIYPLNKEENCLIEYILPICQ